MAGASRDAIGTVLGAAVNIQQRPGGVTESEPTWLAGLSLRRDRQRCGCMRRRPERSACPRSISCTTPRPAIRSCVPSTPTASSSAPTTRSGSASTVGVSAFATDARDFIERLSGSPFENQDRYRFRGAELTVQTTRIPRLDLRGAYSFLDSDERDASDASAADAAAPSRQPRMGLDAARRVGPCAARCSRPATQLYDSRGSNPGADGGRRLHAGRSRIHPDTGAAFSTSRST